MSGNDSTARNIEELVKKRAETYDPYEYEQISKKIETLHKYRNDLIENKYHMKYYYVNIGKCPSLRTINFVIIAQYHIIYMLYFLYTIYYLNK